MNHSNIKSVSTTVCVEEVMEVLQELLDSHWTWTIQLILSEAQQHVDLTQVTDYRQYS